MKIAVYGTGGVGGYFGGRLALAGAEVHLIARGAHLQSLRQRGLRVRSLRGDFEVALSATDDPADIGPSDFVIFSVKSFDTEQVAGRLEPLLHRETAVVSFQNGVDNEEKIARAIGLQHVMGGAAYIFSTIAEPGVIEDTGGPARLVFGEFDRPISQRAERLLELCRKADIDAHLSEDIRSVLWDKFAFICALAGMTAAVRLPLGEIREAPEAWRAFRRVVAEACAVAAAEGVILAEGTVNRHVAFAEGLEAESFSSLHYDLTHGKPMELEALHGTVVRLGREHGVPVPTSEAIYAILQPWAERNR
ncbi:MAG: ketopantoate reductase family protein [Actinomycetota bacterium]